MMTRQIGVDQVAVCEGKAVFADWNMAVKASARLIRRERGHRRGTVMTPYRCRFCGAWHIGTKAAHQ